MKCKLFKNNHGCKPSEGQLLLKVGKLLIVQALVTEYLANTWAHVQ